MKFAKLLTGVAVATMMAGAASAQIVQDSTADASTDIGAAFTIASERNLTVNAPAALTGDLEFDIQGAAAGSFEAAYNPLADTDNVDVTITLTGAMTFGANLSNANFVGDVATCVFTIKSGGAAGSQTVTYTLLAGTPVNNDAKDCDGGNSSLEWSIPLSITGAGNFSVSTSLATTGTQLATATFDALPAAGTQGFVRVASGYGSDFAANTGTVAIDLTAVNPYTTFDPAAGNTTMGTVTVNDALDAGATNGVLFFASNAGQVATSISAAANQQNGGSLAVTFPSPAGIASATLGLAAPVTANLVGGVATFTLTQAQMGELVGAIPISVNAATGAAAAQIANQTPSATLSVTPTAGNNLTIGGATENLDRLVREGSNSTTFEWVGDASTSTTNVWRLTGIGSTLPTIRATFSNATNGASFNGEKVVTPSATLSNGELVLTTADLAAANGAFGRADVAFSIEASGVTIRRFLLGANGTLTTFDGDFDSTCTNASAGILGNVVGGATALNCTQ